MNATLRAALRWAVSGTILMVILLSIGAGGPASALGRDAQPMLPQVAALADAKPCAQADPGKVFALPTSGYMGMGFDAHGSVNPRGIDIWTYEPTVGCGACKDPQNTEDCARAPGNEVRAAFKGTVQAIYWGNHSGNWRTTEVEPTGWARSVVILKHTDVPGVTGDVYTIYQHLADNATEESYIRDTLKVGDPVDQGQLLGYQGNWQYWTEGDNKNALITHLHFEVACDLKSISDRVVVDPVKFLGISATSCDAKFLGLGTAGDGAAVVEQTDMLVASPGETLDLSAVMRNSGSTTWRPAEDYYLLNEAGAWGNASHINLAGEVKPGETTRWGWAVPAPATVGIHTTTWRMRHGDGDFGDSVRITAVVVPADAVELRTKIQDAIDQAKDLGGSRDELVERLKRMIADELEKAKQGIIQSIRDWLQRTLEGICGGAAGLLLVPALLVIRRRLR